MHAAVYTYRFGWLDGVTSPTGARPLLAAGTLLAELMDSCNCNWF
jgi:hypothetical protein